MPRLIYSSKSCDGLIREDRSVHGELVVQWVPLEIVVLLDVNGTVNNWLTDIEEQEHWSHWVIESGPIS